MCGTTHEIKSILCMTRSCKLAILKHDLFHDLVNAKYLKEDFLTSKILEVSPPMETQSKKLIRSFLNMFRMDIHPKGTILALEKSDHNRAFLVVKGDVACFKKLYSLQSKDCEERNLELKAIS